MHLYQALAIRQIRQIIVTVALCSSAAAWALPTPQAVKAGFRASETLVLSREGQLLQRVRTDMHVRRGQWVALADISPSLRMALLLSEDQRFYAHSGIDWQAVSAAAWGNLWHQKTRGASTITMQLAGLLDEDWRSAYGGRSLGQKLGQALAAKQLERTWRKDQILETYLNLLPFRGELVGIDALSRSLFGKAAHGLDLTESAIAAALVRGPNATPAVVAQRACQVWQTLVRGPQGAAAASVPDCGPLNWTTQQVLGARRWPATEGIAPHWSRRVVRELESAQEKTTATATANSGSVRTTVSAGVQRLALESLQRHLRELQGRQVEDGAVVVLDNRSGQVMAWVGSSGGLSQAQEVDGVLAWRQPGSTLKPFLYAQAIQAQRLTAASLIEDSAAQITTASGLYIPQNYDRRFKGWVSVRSALAASLNVPAVRTLVMVTPDAFFTQLRQLGMPLRENAGFYGYSLALGSAEVPLLHLTNAYRALANGGQWSAVAPVQHSTAPGPAVATVQALSPQAAFIVGDILADAQARALTFGLDSVLTTRFWSAVKTGTSKDMRDNWAVGWSQRYTVGVWVGNASGRAMHGVSGSSGAAPIWADVMAGLHAQVPSRAPLPPAGVVQQAVQFAAASKLPGAAMVDSARQEWFVAGTQQVLFHTPAAQTDVPQGTPARIVQPVTGSILALDPDIPPERQLLQLHSNHDQVRWHMDGKLVGQGRQAQWRPWPGKHTLQLQDARGRVLDEVQLEVRGAGVRGESAPP